MVYEIVQFAATWIELEDTILNELGQKKDKDKMISLICSI